jgi:inorganic pyrophosphatase
MSSTTARILLGVTLIISVILVSSCGDAPRVTQPQPKEYAAIVSVLRDRWQKGYMTEDVDLYMSAYWKDGFLYRSDMGTDDDPTDDVIFNDYRQERESAIRVFAKFQDIEIELSEPPEITILEPGKKAQVKNHYRIQGYVADGTTLEGGFTGFYAEGDNTFIFEYRQAENGKWEWRITEWHDEAYTPEEIKAAYGIE